MNKCVKRHGFSFFLLSVFFIMMYLRKVFHDHSEVSICPRWLCPPPAQCIAAHADSEKLWGVDADV